MGVTDRALVRVGLDTDGTHRTTDPIPGAQAAEVRVRGNRLITARADAITSHTLTPTLQPGEGTTVAMDAAAVSGLAASADADRIWLARPVSPSAGDAGRVHKNRVNDAGSSDGPASRVTAFDRGLMPQWQRDLPGRIIALASAPADQEDIAVWALQPRQLVGLDEAGTTVAGLDLPPGPSARAFVPLEDQRFAVADVRGVRLFDATGQSLADQRRVGIRELHAVTGDDSTGLLWAVGRHSLALLDEQLLPVRTWHLPAQALQRPVAASTVDPRDGTLWFVSGDSLYNADSDGALTEHRDLFAYLGTDPVTDLALYADTFAPELTVIEPAEPLVTNNDQPDLVLEYDDTGIGVDPDTLTVEQDGAPIDGACETDTEEQRIECVIGPFDDGTHTVTATVADYAGNESEPAQATFEIDTVAPEITIESPADGAHLNTEAVTVRGQLSETAELFIDGEAAGLDVDNRFDYPVALDSDGARSIELEATDGAGNRATRVLTVIRDTVAPAAIVAAGLTVEAGDEAGQVRITGADGSAEPDTEVVITNTRTGDTIVVEANAQGAFTATIAGEVGDTYEIVVRDAAGNESEAKPVTGVDEDVPPDPADIAPPLPATGVPPFEEQISFLYEGDNAIQQDVAPGTIEARRVSVLRGNVRNRAGDPIPGVRITILNHPELGHTATQADGDFDLAVNGGGALTVEYQKDGYLPVQRTVATQWNGWYHADDVVMIPLDDQVATIDLTDDSRPFQVAQGSVVTDADGTRQATVLFPAGTTAEITLPDGTKKQLSQLDVRATEYTVGDTGPAAMPGALPPASAYTYAVELSVDQALEQGVKIQGKDVVFNQPVPVYVDNFLDFPVGEPVPVGYYNNDSAAWVPHDNGRIIGVLDEQDGRAILDVTGDGEPATAEELDALGIIAAERARLAELHDPGDSLWRFASTHLSTWDCNWPYGPPDDGSRPMTPPPETAHDGEPDNSDEENPCDGCVISPQKQSLGESIDIAGTPYSLHYESDRVDGARNNRVTIPLTGDELPDSLEQVELTIEVAGRIDTYTFPPEPNQSYKFIWDGRDAFGRERYGSEVANIELTYVCPCQYYGRVGGAPVAGGGSIFGRFGGIANPIGTRSRCQGFEFPRSSQVVLESPLTRVRTAGQWSISVAHEFDLASQQLGLGNGAERQLGDGSERVFAGTDESGYSGDGGPAIQAKLRRGGRYGNHYLDAGPDGTLYIMDDGNHRIRAVGPDGVIRTVAGTGEEGYDGDGGAATGARIRIDRRGRVTAGPNGNVYFAQMSNHVIRRISPDGTINTVAGTGEAGNTGDGGPATDARLKNPTDIAIAPDGTLYVTEYGNHQLRRIAPDGTISTVGGLSLQYPMEVWYTEGGVLYVRDHYSICCGGRLWRIESDGRATQVTNGYDHGRFWTEPAYRGQFPDVPAEVMIEAISPDGRWYTYYKDQVLTQFPSAHFGTGDTVSVAAEDGTRQFRFDRSGLLHSIRDARTGSILHRLERDGERRLLQVTDGDGNTTTIERNADGDATAIIAPDGQRTELTVDANGHLTALTDPSGATWLTEYTDDGLLTRIEKPGGAANTFAYDANGRLVEDIDPNGGGWQLSRTELEDGYRTEMISGEGRVHGFTAERPDAFTRVYTNEAPDGTVTKRTHTDSDTTVERADGTVVTTEEAPDPRFGMGAPYVAERSIELPSGLVFQASTDRSTTLADPTDPLSLETLTETVTTNGRTRTTAYDGPARTWTATSPTGRTATTVVDDQSRPLEQTVPGIEPVRTAYDDRGRISTVEQGSGTATRTTGFEYHTSGDQAGYLAAVTDALGRTASFETDAAGRVTQQTLPDGRTIGYQYDGRGNLTAITPPGREAHVFEYDGLDQRADYTPPDLDGTETVTRYTYNLDRQIREIERPSGDVVTFDYDTGGRLSIRRMPVGDTSYGYDATTGQVVSIDAPGGVGLQFQWEGFLPTQTDWTGPVSGSVARTFDHNFWLTQESVNGNPVTFGYDDDGLLTSVGNLSVSRDADNGLITGTTQADVTGTRDYNAFGELADRAVTTDGTTVYDVEYTRDKLGRIVEETETLGGETHTWQYDYDVAGRLVEVRRDGTPVHLYDYDANGNRTSHTGPAGTRTGTYDAQDRITSYGDATYTHTEAGERATKTDSSGTTTYDYDAAGNLRAVTLPDGTEIEYLVDGQDRRIGKVVDGVLQEGWLYRDQLNPVAQLDADGNVIHRFVYGDKANVPAYMIKDGTTYRIVSDHLGSVRLVIETTTSEVVQRMDYDPFGQVTTDTNPGFQPFGFAGGLYDRDTELVRFGARDLDPEIGRWTAKDPILFQGDGTNVYGYTLNNPLNAIDINGLWTVAASFNVNGGAGYGGTAGLNFVFGYGENGISADIQSVTGAGAYGGASAGASFGLEITNADDVCELEGFGYQFGGSVGEGAVLEGNLFGGDGYQGLSASIGLGGGTPAAGYGYGTYTTSWP